MIVLDRKPLTIAQAKEYVDLDKDEVLKAYFKSFSKLSKDKAEKLVSEVLALNNIKVKEEHAIKVADFLPQDSEDLNKIFNDVSLTEEESNAILQIVKNY